MFSICLSRAQGRDSCIPSAMVHSPTCPRIMGQSPGDRKEKVRKYWTVNPPRCPRSVSLMLRREFPFAILAPDLLLIKNWKSFFHHALLHYSYVDEDVFNSGEHELSSTTYNRTPTIALKVSDREGHGHKAVLYKSHFPPLRHSVHSLARDTIVYIG